MNLLQYCRFEAPHYLIYSSNVPPLVYYSHLPIALISFGIGLYVFLYSRKDLTSQIMMVVNSFFTIWVVLDSIFWASNRSDVIMFVWAMQILVEPVVHIGTTYLLYVLLYKKDVNFKIKFITFLVYLPLILSVPTKLMLTSFDISSCLSQENIYSYYTYVIEFIFTVLLIYIGVHKFIIDKEKIVKRETFYLTFGTLILLFAFSWGSIIGSFTEDWNLAQYGLFGMPIFMGFLAYSIVKFRLFNLKIIGSNVLVISLWILMASLLAIQDIDISHAVTGITLIISIIFGFILINSVRREVYQREHIEILANDLTRANTRLRELDKQKSEFVSFATHQLRAPLTAMKGYASLILEGEMGSVSGDVKQAISRIYDSANTLTSIVNDYLNISRIELGSMKYSFEILDMKDIVNSVIGELRPNIEKKGLKLNFTADSQSNRYMIHADRDKFKQVIANLIDNSVKYTPSGSIDISLSRNSLDRKILFTIKDTGVGISPEVMPKLFSKFIRADSANKQNIYGTGLGLYVAKEIVNAHKGKLWAESEGDGKGSTFYLELDMEV